MLNLGDTGDFVSIIVGDAHVSGQNPIARKDNYPLTILRKMEEVIDISRELGADAIFSVGDIFHTPDPSNITKGNLGHILNKRECPFITLGGNHDLFGGNMETFLRTGIGLFSKLGNLEILQDDTPRFFKKGRIRFQLTGQNYHPSIDHRNPEMDYCRTKAEGITHSMHMAHGYLTDKKLLFPHTLIERIKDSTGADVTISGHLHTPFRVNHNGKIFANPGALGRRSASAGEMRMPKVFILRITQEGVLTLEDRYLQTAAPPEEVLNREHLEEDHIQNYRMSRFIDGLADLNKATSQTIDIYEIVHQVAEDEHIEEAVKQDVLAAISAAEAEVQIGQGGYSK